MTKNSQFEITVPARWKQYCLLGFVVAWLAFQILFPLRHLLYPGSPSWTEEGHRFAWQMKLRDKNAIGVFYVYDPAGRLEWTVDPNRYLLPHQARKMIKRPDMVLQFAHYLEDIWSKEYPGKKFEVRARVCVSLNGRRSQVMIDPKRDLTQIKRSLKRADWIVPLHQPFERPENRKYRRELIC